MVCVIYNDRRRIDDVGELESNGHGVLNLHSWKSTLLGHRYRNGPGWWIMEPLWCPGINFLTCDINLPQKDRVSVSHKLTILHWVTVPRNLILFHTALFNRSISHENVSIFKNGMCKALCAKNMDHYCSKLDTIIKQRAQHSWWRRVLSSPLTEKDQYIPKMH